MSSRCSGSASNSSEPRRRSRFRCPLDNRAKPRRLGPLTFCAIGARKEFIPRQPARNGRKSAESREFHARGRVPRPVRDGDWCALAKSSIYKSPKEWSSSIAFHPGDNPDPLRRGGGFLGGFFPQRLTFWRLSPDRKRFLMLPILPTGCDLRVSRGAGKIKRRDDKAHGGAFTKSPGPVPKYGS